MNGNNHENFHVYGIMRTYRNAGHKKWKKERRIKKNKKRF